MRTPGQTIDSPYFGAIREMPEDSHSNMEGVPCEGNIHASNVFLGANSWQDKENPGRPYMHIMGECLGIKGYMPYGVTELTFEEGKGIPVDIFYEFTDDELSSMVKKGLFKPGFTCPEEMYTNVLEMPIVCNFTAVAPQNGSKVPILFADIADKQYIVTNSEDCGYTFGDYFKEAVAPTVEDEFLDFMDIEVTDDLLEQPEEDKSEDVVIHYEPTEAEKEVAKHYGAIHKRVERDHINKAPKHLNKVITPNLEQSVSDKEEITEEKHEQTEVMPKIAEEAASKVMDVEVDEHGDVDAEKANHDMLMQDIADADELMREGALTDLTEDSDYRKGTIEELFSQDPDTVIERMEDVAKFEESVSDVVIRAKAEAKRMQLLAIKYAEDDRFDEDVDEMLLEAMSGEEIGDDFKSDLIPKVVPERIADVAEQAEKARKAEEAYADFDDALE